MHSAACPGHCWGDSGGLVLTHVGTALGGAGLRVRESITDQVMLGSGSSLGSNPPPPGELSPSPGRWFRLVPSLTSSSAEPLAVACCLLPSVCTSWPDRDGNSPLDLSLFSWHPHPLTHKFPGLPPGQPPSLLCLLVGLILRGALAQRRGHSPWVLGVRQRARGCTLAISVGPTVKGIVLQRMSGETGVRVWMWTVEGRGLQIERPESCPPTSFPTHQKTGRPPRP